MYISEHIDVSVQQSRLGNHIWSVSRLFALSKDLPVMEIPLDHLNVYNRFNKMSLRDMVMHIKAVNAADLSYPIILDEDGEIMNGRHRIMKALLQGEPTIKAVRFTKNPKPCEISKE